MKNVSKVMSIAALGLLSGFAVAGDDKAGLHGVILVEKLAKAHNIPYASTRLFYGTRYVDATQKEALYKECDSCLMLEKVRRLMAQAPLIKFDSNSNHEEYYNSNCPKALYQSFSDNTLSMLIDSFKE